MGLACGIVGLPNVGKSTLFNALARTAAATVANYPFTTIEPNAAEVPVPDPRLHQIAEVAASPRVVPARLEVVDIAGLVRDASHGEGLGNRFLANIRETDAIIHVLCCFEVADTTHGAGTTEPIADAETVNTELMLSDLDRTDRLLQALSRRRQGGDKEAAREARLLEMAREVLAEGIPARACAVPESDRDRFRALGLLTAKPILYVANVEEGEAATGNQASARIAELAATEGAGCVTLSAKLEAELSRLDDGDREAFLREFELEASGTDQLARIGYALLDLITFFTCGPKEARAWTVPRGTTAVTAAGRIHTDFARGFIRAETIKWQDFVSLGGETAAREAGATRSEGRDYLVEDGDVIRFRFNV